MSQFTINQDVLDAVSHSCPAFPEVIKKNTLDTKPVVSGSTALFSDTSIDDISLVSDQCMVFAPGKHQNETGNTEAGNRVAKNDLFLDSQSLQQIKLQGDRELALRQIAEQFEAIFVQQMLKQMRSASRVIADEDNPLTSHTDSMYQQMLDSQLALDVSQSSSIGIAEMIVKQMS